MTFSRRLFGACAAILVTLGAAHAAPPIIEEAKANCVVGERIDGYLGIVDGAAANDALRREVRVINQQRSAAYDNLASKNGVTVAVAAKATAERVINGAPSGHCVQNESGEWIRVP
ncbi:hypothetical protein PB2503_12844 [Parvularcula bermudensis HTCC2503]|uniref:DUF1318 domain-containing protein n=1 Tax=Parvularcula bermudensis (strain ATCC BAA-594 / HTCC2503 / KCTC 12087) TaxID=314260 RepID=E0TG35_PARBH|nr:YdbL family protein [Parvularcula bermudensis]ADM10606.1 hypothetical protein PB2503_12844 [Parvularcula bermudensis HTCC2503]